MAGFPVHELIDGKSSFALLARIDRPGEVELIRGDCVDVQGLDGLSSMLDQVDVAAGCVEAVVAVPYHQVTERGFDAAPEDLPLLALLAAESQVYATSDVVDALLSTRSKTPGMELQPDLSDRQYAAMVADVIRDEVEAGQGSNFVVSRSYEGVVGDLDVSEVLGFFGSLLSQESGSYWTFLLWTPDHGVVGASPECHLSVVGGEMVMNPISGTFRYSADDMTAAALEQFLSDPKETDELYMVVDEELKILAKVCDADVRVEGPGLKFMGNVAHSEYHLRGRTSADRLSILKETLMAPTVTGSPQESACRVIKRHERSPRGYYSGVLARLGRDDTGQPTLDSSILIRTAHIDRTTGLVSARVGASIVRSSDPRAEALETESKIRSLLDALQGRNRPAIAPELVAELAEVAHRSPTIADRLAARNSTLAPFWLSRAQRTPVTGGMPVRIIDAEDRFTDMLAYQLRALGMNVDILGYDSVLDAPSGGLTIVGPGPGDPLDASDPKIATLHFVTRALLSSGRPFLSICLGHQVLSAILGLDVIRKAVPNQGTQIEIDLFGQTARLGFYNSFSAVSEHDRFTTRWGNVDVARSAESGEVHGLVGPRFRSFQFHPESVLSETGFDILGGHLSELASVYHQPWMNSA